MGCVDNPLILMFIQIADYFTCGKGFAFDLIVQGASLLIHLKETQLLLASDDCLFRDQLPILPHQLTVPLNHTQTRYPSSSK